MLSRAEVDKAKIKPVEDERLFNNFRLEKTDLSRTCDFTKMKNRSLDFKHKHINGIDEIT